MSDDFDTFWAAYPNKKGKGDARKAFAKAIKLATLETMLAAIHTYKLKKPEWQHFAHPGTWLRQERWDDEWPEQKQQTGGAPRSFDHGPSNVVIRLPENHFSKRWERGEFKKKEA